MDASSEMTDVEYLTRVWKVDADEAQRRAAHLARELIDEQLGGGVIVLKKGLKRERLRFLV